MIVLGVTLHSVGDDDEMLELIVNVDHIKLSTDYSTTIIKSQDSIQIKEKFPVTLRESKNGCEK